MYAGAATSGDPRTKRQKLWQRKGALWTERSTWINRYQDITRVLLPYAGRYCSQDRNKGDRTFNSIYDETATYALDVLAAGMMAGVTSPARPWFRLATHDPDLMEYEPVKDWLYDVTELMRAIYAKSNTYNSLHQVYEELGAFATGASIVEADFDTVIHHTVLTAGEYAIGANGKGQVDTLAREFDMTVSQIVEKFVYNGDYYNKPDWTRVSHTIKTMWDGGNYDSWVTICHMIEPRCERERDTRKLDAKNMKFGSYYFEPGRDDLDPNKLLRESGYRRFPVLAPRWKVSGGDIYGNGPSFRALGSIKQLQQEQLRKGQAIDYQTKPMLQVPVEMKNSMSAILPGAVQYTPGNAQNRKIESAFEVNLQLDHLLLDIQDVRARINKSFYVDLFLMISQDNRRTPATATEIAERHEEKLLMLGPTLERLHNEMLSPKIDMTFDRIMETGIVPPPPPELADEDLKVEFISTLAQAQKMVGLSSLDRLLNTVATISNAKQDPGVWDKIDTDQVIDRYSDMLGTDPTVVRGDDQVVEIRTARDEQNQQMQAAANTQAAAATAKDLGSIDTSQPNALTDIIRQVQGYNAQV